MSAPSPRLAEEGQDGTGSGSAASSSIALRFEMGGGDGDSSSTCSLNRPSTVTPCSQCSSANSLLFRHQRNGSARKRPQAVAHRSRTATGDSASGASLSLPKLVALVAPVFPPASIMLSSEALNAAEQSSSRRESAGSAPAKRCKGRPDVAQSRVDNKQPKEQSNNHNNSAGLLCPPNHQLYGVIPDATSSSDAAVMQRDPARWNLAATKQRSSSESAFGNIPSHHQKQQQCSCCVACASNDEAGAHRCMHAHTIQRLPDSAFASAASVAVRAVSLGMGGGGVPRCPLAARVGGGTAANGTLRRPDSLGALSTPGGGKHPTVAFLNANNPQREQAILQRILGPTGLGWLKQRARIEAGGLRTHSKIAFELNALAILRWIFIGIHIYLSLFKS